MTVNPDYRLEATDQNMHKGFWDNSLEPVLTVEDGDVVRFECLDAFDGQITEQTTPDELVDLDFDPVHPLTGPVGVAGAEPGDVLAVELLEISHHGSGVSAYFPGEMEIGLLPEDFPEGGIFHWDLEGDVGHFTNGIDIPIDPFPGTIGVAPVEDGRHETIPIRHVGGNMDIKHLGEGSTLYLPVAVEDALFSVGDGHATQGNGQVCVTGIEAPIDVTARFERRTDMDIDQPQFSTSHSVPPELGDPMYGTTGNESAFLPAAKAALRQLLDHVVESYELTRGEAYILIGQVADFKVERIHHEGDNWTVYGYLPEAIFPD